MGNIFSWWVWVETVDTVPSIIGFCITIFVLFQVASIKRSFLSRARIPEIVKNLERAASSLNASLPNWPNNKNEAYAQIKVASVLIKNVIPLLAGQSKRQAKATSKKFNKAIENFSEPKYQSFDSVYDLYSDIHSTLMDLNQFSSSLRWL